MVTLFYSPGTASMVVHWLLIELGIKHELRLVDFDSSEQKSPEYLKLNPAGLVPTLVVDGEPYSEAAALVMHLADTHPGASLAPAIDSPQRARYYQWMFFMVNSLQPAFRNWFYPDEGSGAANADTTKECARLRIEDCFTRLDAQLAAGGPYLLGDRLSATDFHLAMLMRWSRNMPKPATEWPGLAKLAARMKARPSFRLLYEREGLSEWA